MTARYTNRIWTTEEFPNDPLRCPVCNKQDLRLIGCVYRAFEAEVKDGEPDGYVLKPEATEQLHQVYCYNCNILFHMEDREIRDMKEANFILAEKVSPTPRGKMV